MTPGELEAIEARYPNDEVHQLGNEVRRLRDALVWVGECLDAAQQGPQLCAESKALKHAAQYIETTLRPNGVEVLR